MRRDGTIKHACVIACVLTFATLANAGGGGMGGAAAGATEVTQLLNNAQLLDANVKQAAIVAQQIQTNIYQAQQYMTMLQNLRNLPSQVVQAARAPYASQVTGLNVLLRSVLNVKQATTQVRQQMNTRMRESRAMGMDLNTYMGYEAQMAQTKGGFYKDAMQQDLDAIDNAVARSAQLQTAMDQNLAVTGNIEGLQLLNQQSSMIAGELIDVKTALLKQSALANQDRADKAADAAAAAQASQASDQKAKGLEGRNGSQFPIQQTWPGP